MIRHIASKYLLLFLFCFLLGCHPQKQNKSGIVYPKLLSTHIAFEYPREAYEYNISGSVQLKVMIDEQGNVALADIYRSSGSQLLDQSALDMIKTAKFEPGTVNGKVEKFWLNIPINYNLDVEKLSKFEIQTWLDSVRYYYSELGTGNTESELIAMNELFFEYQFMAHKSSETRSFEANKSILQVIDQRISEKWGNFEQLWPLGFILFKDYMDRFPDSYYAQRSKEELINYLTREIKLTESQADNEKYREIRIQMSNTLMLLYERDL